MVLQNAPHIISNLIQDSPILRLHVHHLRNVCFLHWDPLGIIHRLRLCFSRQLKQIRVFSYFHLKNQTWKTGSLWANGWFFQPKPCWLTQGKLPPRWSTSYATVAWENAKKMWFKARENFKPWYYTWLNHMIQYPTEPSLDFFENYKTIIRFIKHHEASHKSHETWCMTGLAKTDPDPQYWRGPRHLEAARNTSAPAGVCPRSGGTSFGRWGITTKAPGKDGWWQQRCWKDWGLLTLLAWLICDFLRKNDPNLSRLFKVWGGLMNK